MLLTDYYSWKVILKDNTVVEQSAPGEEEKFKFNDSNKNFKNIKTFILLPKERNVSKVTLEIPDKGRLIYFRRTIANTGNIFPKFHVNIIGWQMTINKVNVKHITYIFPDGTIEIKTDDEPSYTEEFIAGLPKRDEAEIESCTGCKPVLKRKE